MQLSKVLLVIGTTSVSLIPLAGRAADKAPVAPLVAPAPAAPDAVEKARAAMRQKMDQIEPGAAAVTPAPTPAAPVKIIPPPAPAAAPVTPPPAPAPAATVTTPAPAVIPGAPAPAVIPVADPSAIAKAREALEKTMAEMNNQPQQVATPAPQLTKKQRKEQAEAMRQAQAAAKRDAAAQAKAPKSKATFAEGPATSQVAMSQAEQPEAPKAVAPELASRPTKASHAALSFEPMSGPPSPLSAEKQQRLGELLSKYKADQITPEQYHQERAKILAEP